MDSSNASTPELLAYIQQLQQQMVALQNSQALLQENAKNHPIEQAKASTVKTKVPPPDTFHGQRHEVKPFLSNLAIYIKLRPEEFPNEETKLLFAACNAPHVSRPRGLPTHVALGRPPLLLTSVRHQPCPFPLARLSPPFSLQYHTFGTSHAP